MPINFFKINHTAKLVKKTQTKIVAAPINCPLNVEALLVTGTNNKPSRPTTPCTEIAPTGSSIFNLSKLMIEKTTTIPAIAPNNVACNGVGVDGSAVITTKPANAPLRAMVKSAFLNKTFAKINAATAPAAADALVFRNTIATECELAISPSFNTEPPLKPNQPIHKIKVPKVAIGKLEPGIALM